MNPSLMRRFWSFVEMTQASTLLSLDDDALRQWLLRQFGTQQGLNSHEVSWLSDYIDSRLCLVRDLAMPVPPTAH
jgi:hypothetical protein